MADFFSTTLSPLGGMLTSDEADLADFLYTKQQAYNAILGPNSNSVAYTLLQDIRVTVPQISTHKPWPDFSRDSEPQRNRSVFHGVGTIPGVLMRAKVIAIAAAALLPSWSCWLSILGLGVPGGNYGRFWILSGLSWCLLFASIDAFSKNADRKKSLLWLLPLVLFAFTFPVAYAFLWLAFMWEAAHGRAVP